MSEKVLYITEGGTGVGNILLNLILTLAWILSSNEYDKLSFISNRSDSIANFCDIDNNDKIEIIRQTPDGIIPLTAKSFMNNNFYSKVKNTLDNDMRNSISPLLDIHFYGYYQLNTDQFTTIKKYFNPRPNEKVVNVIDNLKSNKNEYIAVHIRGTDFVTAILKTTVDKLQYEHYYTFIDSYKNLPIYLATDDEHIKKLFIEKYGDRIFFYDSFIEAKKIGYEKKNTSELSIYVDMFMCRDAKHFMGTHKSTFSDTIKMLRFFEHHK